MGSPACTVFATLIGVPTSADMMAAISSARAARPSLMRSMNRARSTGGVAAQPSNARAAAFTARSTSTSSPLGIRPTGSSVEASMTSMVPLPEGATQAPSMKNRSWTRMRTSGLGADLCRERAFADVRQRRHLGGARDVEGAASETVARDRKLETVRAADVDESAVRRQPARDEHVLDARREIGIDAEAVEPEDRLLVLVGDCSVERHEVPGGTLYGRLPGNDHLPGRAEDLARAGRRIGEVAEFEREAVDVGDAGERSGNRRGAAQRQEIAVVEAAIGGVSGDWPRSRRRDRERRISGEATGLLQHGR